MTRVDQINRLTGMSFFIAAAVCFAALAILRPGEIGSIRIGPIRTGKDQCASCGMTIEDARFAGRRTVQHGGKPATLLYDDLGCMLDADRENEAGKAIACSVQDFDGAGWIKASDAWYVMDPKNRTPMGSGILAFAKRPAGKVMTFEGVREARHTYMRAKFGG
ncbi:MAG: nitrous oxide reductase accessory protein NosL [Phycisphaerales bacterium]